MNTLYAVLGGLFGLFLLWNLLWFILMLFGPVIVGAFTILCRSASRRRRTSRCWPAMTARLLPPSRRPFQTERARGEMKKWVPLILACAGTALCFGGSGVYALSPVGAS